MAKLYLIRHAQASFGLENYDQLSATGKEQAPFIASHFRNAPELAFRGSMLRHQQTFEIGFGQTEVRVLPEINEFDHMEVLMVHRPEIADKQKVMELIALQKDPKKFLENEFYQAMLKWINEEGSSAYRESFKQFKERCLYGIRAMMSECRQQKRKEVVALTSGGVIALWTAELLGLSAEKMIGLNLGIANASVSAYLFNEHQCSLDYFNNYSHLPTPLVSYR